MITDVIQEISSNVVRIDVNLDNSWITGIGSGLIIDRAGSVLTCAHVVRPNNTPPLEISVVTQDGTKGGATVSQSDDFHDLAILGTDLIMSGEFKPTSYENIKIGQDGYILGYPLSHPHLTLSRALVSAKGKGLISQFPFETIQIDARVNHGNSGGPFFTDQGEIIGAVTMKYIPFLERINELRQFVSSKPPLSVNLKLPFDNFSFSEFTHYVNEGIIRMTKALDMVQVGIGWVIPIRFMPKPRI